ncbi:MAG: glycoside hydrolase family 65 protein [Bacteroidales bacterium]|nr:glycoside hydrolase family 65 protein [Bacteroidales bacterium]
MRNIYTPDPWKIIEEEFVAENHEISESIFSLGNGIMGQRANFEEFYSGISLQGNYLAGIFYPDKTKVGWWKNGYPDYFAKVINAPSWIGIILIVNGVKIDFAKVKCLSFKRVLDMKEGILSRQAVLDLGENQLLKIETQRFISMSKKEVGAISYTLTPENFDASITVEFTIDAEIRNKDANYNETFWDVIDSSDSDGKAIVLAKTKENPFGVARFAVATGMCYEMLVDNKKFVLDVQTILREKYLAHSSTFNIQSGQSATIYKYGAVTTSLFYEEKSLIQENIKQLELALSTGYSSLLNEHKAVWSDKWSESDILIEGDVHAQQGIRFNIFQLLQTYSGDDARFNIGPKGFTGEKYGGSTYWDTEAFCLPFYLYTCDASISRNLLLYRYKQLPNAIKNAQKLGFNNGAALFPMVTMTGDECHNEWEITFEEIHRNGAIVRAIYEYVSFTNDFEYIEKYGFELIVAVARFWALRATYSEEKGKYVILGVTGPNEYENNINNNWYTNYYAKWCLNYAVESYHLIESRNQNALKTISQKLSITPEELQVWTSISDAMFLNYNDKRNIFVQQDGFFDKVILPTSALPPSQRPINQHWSWDRILRSCYIKQADVVQGMYAFEDDFTDDLIKSNFEYYEPLTVHESSLSPSIHSVVASKLGLNEKAYELYLRTARLDLDDYNNEAHEGLHITSMAGTWLAVVKGFAGMRISNELLILNPRLPEGWNEIAFRIKLQKTECIIKIFKTEIKIKSTANQEVKVFNKCFTLQSGVESSIPY